MEQQKILNMDLNVTTLDSLVNKVISLSKANSGP